MLILYTKDNCQYCTNVKRTFGERNIAYEERNIKDQEYLKEAQSYQARTMPFLVDTTSNTILRESDEIIDYASEYAF